MQATAKAMSAARRYRRQLSLPEQLLWRLLRQMRGELKVRRQHPVGPYVADFYCPADKLIIEVDGAAHEDRQHAENLRDQYMRSLELDIVRVRASDVLANPEAVAEALLRLCTPAAGPSTTQPDG
jgi:very-short-patch-repair endonuclease